MFTDMEEMCDELHCQNEIKTISSLPEEILEHILLKLSPYNDLWRASLVCSSWNRLVKVVRKKLQQAFVHGVYTNTLLWSSVGVNEGFHDGFHITERYSHCACYYDKSLYVFGGCTATNTTLNDLWRFDLGSREWIRPLAMGTYPFPKACASLVVYKDNLVLFGGWSHPTPFPLHQAARFFSELHVYMPATNRWSHVTTLSHQSPQPTAGHSASVVGDLMVMFGGSQVPGIRTNDLWAFDFIESAWKKPVTNHRKPAPRYGQIQVTVDDEHILIVGGCGGPNQVFSDIWLLTMGPEQWTWEEIKVANPDWAPAQIWCHGACKVGDMVVTLSKPAKPPKTPPSSPRVSKIRNRSGTQPRDRGKIQQQNSASSSPDIENEDSESSQSDSSNESCDLHSSQSDLEIPGTAKPRPGLPCIRPNAMKNRQRQLEALLKYERKLRQTGAPGTVNPEPGTSKDSGKSTNRPNSSRNIASSMAMHTLHISQVLETKTASWQELKFSDFVNAPDETIFYSLVEGRAELIMFGGIERDIQSLQRGHGIKSHTVNNSLFMLSAKPQKL